MSDLKIGEKTWHRGNEVTITSEAFLLYGAWFQKAVTSSGNEVTLLSASQREADATAKQADWQRQQTQFRKLNK